MNGLTMVTMRSTSLLTAKPLTDSCSIQPGVIKLISDKGSFVDGFGWFLCLPVAAFHYL